MARSVAEAEAMCAAVRDAGVVGMLGFEFRFNPARATLRRMLAGGDLGVPQLVFAADALPLYVAPYKAPPEWWYDADAVAAAGSAPRDRT
jgi:predicted dehydrogenase